MHGNANRYYITAGRTERLAACLAGYFKKGNVESDLMIRAGGAWHRGQRQKNLDAMVQKGETVVVYASPTQRVAFDLQPQHVVMETADWLIVTKPPGLSTVPDRACDRFNLTTAVKYYLRQQKVRYEPVAISRLDLMVSGIVLFPKSKAAEIKLFEAMRNREIAKVYRARLSAPLPSGRVWRVRAPLEFGTKARVSNDGKPSETIFISESPDTTWVRAVPITGRRHQIRIHAAQALSPIVGDSLYGGQGGSGIELVAVGYNFTWDNQRIRCRWTPVPLSPVHMDDGQVVGDWVRILPS